LRLGSCCYKEVNVYIFLDVTLYVVVDKYHYFAGLFHGMLSVSSPVYILPFTSSQLHYSPLEPKVSHSYCRFRANLHEPESLASLPSIFFPCVADFVIWETMAADFSRTLILNVPDYMKPHLTHHHENLTPHIFCKY
jgi:hypothetical protein